MSETPLPDDVGLKRKQTLGLILCSIYALAYGGFVALSVFNVRVMDTLMPFQLNLAVFYGMGLIVFALLLALFYSKACDAAERLPASPASPPTPAPDARVSTPDAPPTPPTPDAPATSGTSAPAQQGASR